MKSVLWTDFIQGSVLLIGVTFGLIFLIAHLDGGFGAIINEFTNNHKFLAENQPIFDANILKDSVFLLIVGAGFNTMAPMSPLRTSCSASPPPPTPRSSTR